MLAPAEGGGGTAGHSPAEGGGGAIEPVPAEGGAGDAAEPPGAVAPPPSPIEREVLSLRDRAKTAEHLRTHFPKNPWCPICQRANARRKQR
eukprot:12516879-Alexandrium_andersonii.AAC.1